MIIVRPTTSYVPPFIVARANNNQTNTFNTSQPITLPTHSAGDLLLVFWAPQASQTSTASGSGWTKIASAGTDPKLEVWAGISGVATTPLTLTSSAGTSSCHVSYSIRSVSQDVSHVSAETASGSGTNANPPALAPPHGSYSYVWIVGMAGGEGSDTAPSAAPSGFSNLVTQGTGSTLNSHSGLGTADATLESGNFDPPSFTSPSASWSAVTVAVLGAS